MVKKDKKKILTIGVLIVIAIFCIGLVVNIVNDKTRIFKKVVNNSYNFINEHLTKFNNSYDIFSNTSVVDASIKYLDTNFNIHYQLDKENKALLLQTNGINNGNDEIALVYLENKTYFKSNKLNYVYDLTTDSSCSEEDCQNNSLLVLNSIIGELMNFNTSGNLLDTLNLETIKKSLLKSFDKKYVSINKVNTLVKEDTVALTRYSYVLNKKSLHKLIKQINKDSKLANLREYVSELPDDNFGTFNIYLDDNKNIVMTNITITDKSVFDISKDNDIITINFDLKENDSNGVITYNCKNDVVSILNYDGTSNRSELKINWTDENNKEISFNVLNNDNKYTGSVSANKLSDSNGVIKISINDITFDVDYEISKNIEKISSVGDNILEVSKMTTEDKEVLSKIFNDLTENELIKQLTSLFQNVENEEEIVE